MTFEDIADDSSRPEPWSVPMTTLPNAEPIEILLVDDDAADAKRTIDALAGGRIRNRITHVKDGVEAMNYLWREGEYADAPRPDLILLDLNMPRMDGREVLAEIKADLELRRIPVVMMTASSKERDIMEAYDLHVNGYVVKPVDVDQFINAVRSIEHFWFSVVKLPAA